jgi:hypothetical protein
VTPGPRSGSPTATAALAYFRRKAPLLETGTVEETPRPPQNSSYNKRDVHNYEADSWAPKFVETWRDAYFCVNGKTVLGKVLLPGITTTLEMMLWKSK